MGGHAEREGVHGTIAWGHAALAVPAGVHGPQQQEEDDMSDTTPALDEAFERMAAVSFGQPASPLPPAGDLRMAVVRAR
jgi:hypothetical protein